MKLPEKETSKRQKTKMKPISKPKKEKVLLVAQEFKFARLLAENEKTTRDRVLRTLKKWLMNCFEKKYAFKEDDFVRVWKGLFYAVWMSDKPLIQEDLCESIGAILDLFPTNQIEYAILMTKAGFKVLATEWYGIDQHRMDKFLMLVRRYLRSSFRCLQRCEWSLKSCQTFSNMLSSSDGILALKTPIYARNAASMMLHITDCYLEELSKVSKGKIPDESLVALLYPFSVQVCGGDGTLAIACRRLLTALIRQSDLGLEYDIVSSAWKKMGCPAGGPEALERVSDDDSDGDDDDDGPPDESFENNNDTNGVEPLDPRAGRVNVTLEPLPVPARLLADQLRRLMTTASSKAYKRAKICLQRFEELSGNQYPLRVPAADAAGLEPNLDRSAPRRAAKSLRALEKQLVSDSDELALRGLSRKHRKRLLARSRSGVNIVDEIASQTTTADSTNGGWHVETTEPENKIKKSDLNENVIVDKKKNRKRKLQEKKDKNKKPKIDKTIDSEVAKGKQFNKIKVKEPDTTKIETAKNIKTDNAREEKKSKKNNLSKDNINLPSSSDKLKHAVNLVSSNKVKGPGEKKTLKKVLNGKTTKQMNSTTNNEILKNKIKNHSKNLGTKDNILKPSLVVNKIKKYQKQVNGNIKKDNQKKKVDLETPKKVKFVLKNNSMQGAVDYYKSVRQNPNIPFDSSKTPIKTNLKPSTPSPINPFLKKKNKFKKM